MGNVLFGEDVRSNQMNGMDHTESEEPPTPAIGIAHLTVVPADIDDGDNDEV